MNIDGVLIFDYLQFIELRSVVFYTIRFGLSVKLKYAARIVPTYIYYSNKYRPEVHSIANFYSIIVKISRSNTGAFDNVLGTTFCSTPLSLLIIQRFNSIVFHR